jgi:nanoRNase/pAp phosphatase (c-di-AMP/oligoRNAs hydrolase)
MAVRFQKDGRYKYALSCYNQFIGLENFDLRKFARMLDANGGGHRGAVGFFFDGSFAELQAKLQDFIRDELGPN